MREYVKYSLYDRISTRPFLSVLEKKWITFQVLYALYQCHKLGICHGDIKVFFIHIFINHRNNYGEVFNDLCDFSLKIFY